MNVKTPPLTSFTLEAKVQEINTAEYTSKKDGQKKQWTTCLIKYGGRHFEFPVDGELVKSLAIDPIETGVEYTVRFDFKTFKSLQPVVTVIDIHS